MNQSKLLLILVLSLSSCVTVDRFNNPGLSYDEIRNYLTKKKPKIDLFFKMGPIPFETTTNFVIPLNHKLKVRADLFFPKQDTVAPLLIFQHGNKSSKRYHKQQARLAASWGMNAMTVQQPNQKQWIKNGRNLGKLVNLIAIWPEIFRKQFDPKKIILVGHSFGGSAVAIASGMGAPVQGLIFLDPALVHKSVRSYLKKIEAPSILIGADKKIFRSRKRRLFFSLVHGPKIEFSIKGATHNDAQYPNMFSWKQTLGLAPNPDEDRQRQFAAAIVGSAFVLANGFSAKSLRTAIGRSENIAIKNFRTQQ